MAEFVIRKAQKSQAWLRMGISGPAGSGKTFTALKVASGLAGERGKIAVIDTQRGQADHYGDDFSFDLIELNDHHPESFIRAMNALVKEGYTYIIIDSATHEWTGKNGCLELHEEVARKTKNTFTAWKEVTPLHNKFFDTINNIPANVIGTIRAKQDHVQEKNEQTGKTEVKKVGMGTIQREGADYEFDILMEMDIDHYGTITKCRDGESKAGMDGKVFKKPGAEFVESLRSWLSSGAAPSLNGTQKQSTESDDTDKSLKAIYLEMGKSESEWDSLYAAEIRGIDVATKKKKLDAWQKAANDRKAKTETQPEESVLLTQIEERFAELTKLGVKKQEQDKLVATITLGAPLDECDDTILRRVALTLTAAINEAKGDV